MDDRRRLNFVKGILLFLEKELVGLGGIPCSRCILLYEANFRHAAAPACDVLGWLGSRLYAPHPTGRRMGCDARRTGDLLADGWGQVLFQW